MARSHPHILNEDTLKEVFEIRLVLEVIIFRRFTELLTFFLLFHEYFGELPKLKKPENIVFAGF